MKPNVYFINEISKEALMKVYEALNKNLDGNVAVKVHSGEKGNQNFLHPEFMKEINLTDKEIKEAIESLK